MDQAGKTTSDHTRAPADLPPETPPDNQNPLRLPNVPISPKNLRKSQIDEMSGVLVRLIPKERAEGLNGNGK